MASLKDNIFEVMKSAFQRDFSDFVDGTSNINSSNEYSSMFTNGFIFSQYSNLKDAFEKIEDVRESSKNLPNDTYQKIALVYVSGSQYQNFQKFKDYINETDPKKAITKDIIQSVLTNIKSFINLGGLYQKDKIVVTQDNRGIFDFGLASLGLYRPIEFFSEELKRILKMM